MNDNLHKRNKCTHKVILGSNTSVSVILLEKNFKGRMPDEWVFSLSSFHLIFMPEKICSAMQQKV